MEKVVILVDVQNIYYTTKQIFDRNFDYNLFWQQVTGGREVIKAIAYAVDRGDEKQRQFQNILRAIGFEVRLKPYIQRKDGSSKGDWDVGIAIDALKYANDADVVVLASGDGDFDLLANEIREILGKQFEVYGVSALTARSLIESCSKYFPVTEELLMKKTWLSR